MHAVLRNSPNSIIMIIINTDRSTRGSIMRARSAVRDLQHERSGRVADKARGEAECFIRYETTPRVL